MSSIEEIAANLERQLADATARIDDFAAAQSAALTKSVAEYEQAMREMEAKINKALGDEAAVGARTDALREQLENENLVLSERNAELLKLEAATRALPVEVDAARAAEAAARGQLEAQRTEYEKREGEVRHTLNELTKGVAFYRRLGLEFERIKGDRLRLTFTQIDPRDAGRVFAFNVKVSDSDVYSVDSVEPALDGVDALLAELNATNNFSAFVQRMRQKFKQLCL